MTSIKYKRMQRFGLYRGRKKISLDEFRKDIADKSKAFGTHWQMKEKLSPQIINLGELDKIIVAVKNEIQPIWNCLDDLTEKVMEIEKNWKQANE